MPLGSGLETGYALADLRGRGMTATFEDSFIEGLRSRISLAALIGQTVILRKTGKEHLGLCPFHQEKTPSFNVNDTDGVYLCRGCGATGDIFSWVQHQQRIGFPEAVRYLAGADLPAPSVQSKPTYSITRPPAEAPVPDCWLKGWGKPRLLTPYRDAEATTLFYVARYERIERQTAEKTIRPWSWDSLTKAWVAQGFPFPRPVMCLPAVLSTQKPVLIVEGEKKRDAIHGVVGKVYEVTAWAGGAQAIKHTDWAPLFGRRILLWPDADRKLIQTETEAGKYNTPIGHPRPYDDQPGPATMRAIAALLAPHCPEVKLIDVGIDPERPDGWDAGDAVAAGMDWSAFVAWAKPRISLFQGAEVVNLARERAARQPDPPAPASDEASLPTTLHAIWDEIGLQLNGQGTPIANLDNAVRALERWPVFANAVWYDEFYDRCYTTWGATNGHSHGKEWSDGDTLRLLKYLQRDIGIRNIKKGDVKDAMFCVAQQSTRNAPRDWLKSLTWDGVDRIEMFFPDMVGAIDCDYVRAASKNFWISIAARIMRPGCKVDTMVIFEGQQGKLKSTAFDVIGGDWFTESGASVTEKDFFQQLQGKLIIEIAELDGFSRADMRRIKSVISRRVDRFRASYGHFSEDHPRQCIFVGTTNEQHYLEDTTGARRFWPIRTNVTGDIDIAGIRANRDQLFAEARARFDRDEPWWEMPAEETMREQERRREADEWESVVARYLGQIMVNRVTMAEVAKDAFRIDESELDKPTQRRIAQALRLAGWVNKNTTGVDRWWERP